MKWMAGALLCVLFAAQGLDAAPKKGKKGQKGKAAPAAAPAAPAAEAPAAEAMSSPPPVSGEGGAYGMAGCGLGSLVIGSKGKFPQIGAAFLNASGSQLFGITSGTSNCSEAKADVALRERKIFVASNLSTLSKEAAQGGGPHMAGLAEVLGCSSEEHGLRLGQLSQEKYDEIFAEQEPDEVLAQYEAAIEADPELSAHCLAAS